MKNMLSKWSGLKHLQMEISLYEKNYLRLTAQAKTLNYIERPLSPLKKTIRAVKGSQTLLVKVSQTLLVLSEHITD